jgi:5'-3' exonuclease
MSNLARKNAFAAVKQNPYDNRVWRDWVERTINDLMDFVEQFKADRCVLAMDDSIYWRTGEYPEYKGNRKQFKKDAIIDFDSLDEYYYNFMKRFTAVFSNFYCMKVDSCEADDIIAVLAKHHKDNEATIIVSADKDFNQLKKFPNVVRYNPVTRREVSSINPQRELEIKIILGDPNDGIPQIKRGYGIKKAEQLINTRADLANTSDSLLMQNYKRNRVLIDFEFIPLSIQLSIVDRYKSTVLQPVNTRNIFPFFMEYGTSTAINKWQVCKDTIMRLK